MSASFAVDGISLFFFFLTALLAPFVKQLKFY